VFLLPDQSAALVYALSSKQEMFFLAKKHGIPTPEAVFPESKQDVLEFVERALFPVMLKGIDGFRLWKRTGKKMFVASSRRELVQAYEAAEDPQCPNLMIQEYIPGGDDTVWMFNGYFNAESDCLVGFTGKKLRQCPVHTGSTSLGICLPNEEVENTTRRFMKSIGYRGILDIGYRYDARDGQHKVLDINPRIGATFRLFAASNGMDVVRALYLDLTKQPLPSATIVPGRKWIAEDLDLVSIYRYRREGNITLREWLHSLRGIDEMAYLAKDDLLPLLPLWINRIAELGRRLLGRSLRTRRNIVAVVSPQGGKKKFWKTQVR
jgi:D-aspartate ligase